MSHEIPFGVGHGHSVMVTWEKSSCLVLVHTGGVLTRTCGFSRRFQWELKSHFGSGNRNIQRLGGHAEPIEVRVLRHKFQPLLQGYGWWTSDITIRCG
jgi:hypothetical protein